MNLHVSCSQFRYSLWLQSFRELHEFVEELLATVLSNCLEPHPFGRRVAALFLLYAIYFKQPLLPKVCFKVLLPKQDDFPNLSRLTQGVCHLLDAFK